MRVLMSLAGMALILLIAVLLSSNRRAISLRVVAPAFALQAGFAALVLYFPPGNAALQGRRSCHVATPQKPRARDKEELVK